jgi:hypothetical protein
MSRHSNQKVIAEGSSNIRCVYRLACQMDAIGTRAGGNIRAVVN